MGRKIEGFTFVNDNYTVTNCRNGFVVEVGGKDQNEDWITTKFVFTSLDELKGAVEELAAMPRC